MTEAAESRTKKKKLAIFCDGTWNDLRMADRTNVSRLAKCVAPTAADGVTPQIVFYDEGVGVGSGVSQAVDKAVKYVGGALGRGLDRKIEAAYRFLVTNYEPGDEIYVFGFSRGAYTARSLCGLIRKCGILKRDCFDRTPEALTRYRNGVHPSDPEMQAFRRQYAHPVAAGLEDHDRLGLAEGEHAAQTSPARLADLYQYRAEPTYRLMFLGLWDTVGSLGVPERLLGRILNAKYKFHDTETSALIASLRHAVAIDEKRKVFSSTPVTNVDELNDTWAQKTGWSVESPGAADFVPYGFRPYQQIWFPGDHGAVGGGNPQPGLSSVALLWIAEGAERAGLHLVRTAGNELGRALELANPCAEWRIKKDGTTKGWVGRHWDLLGQVGGFQLRKGPMTIDAVGTSAWERWCRDPDYRPDNLSVMTGRPCPQPQADASPAGFPPAA